MGNTMPPGGGTGPGTGPILPDPCNTPACTGAKAELTAARNDFNRTCTGLRGVVGFLRFLRAIVSIPIWVIVALIIAAVILLWFGLVVLAIILWTFILIYFLAIFLIWVFVRVEASLLQNLADRESDVIQAKAKVVAACPVDCQGDLSVPICDAYSNP
jgi:membrane protein implicated in regulation of membrane protease activity